MIHHHLPKMPVLANPVNADLSRDFTVVQVAEKYDWPAPMTWALALEKLQKVKTATNFLPSIIIYNFSTLQDNINVIPCHLLLHIIKYK